jgi:glycosyltransferase involved in cell wall biosynthesis
MHDAEDNAGRRGRAPSIELSVIVPAYNEAATIGEVLRRLRTLSIRHEVIVVDDGSTDDTATIVAGFPEVVLLSHPHNLGKGAAISTALPISRGRATIIQDADLEYHPGDISALYDRYMQGDVAAVYGSRNLRKNPRSSQLFYYGGVMVSVFTSLLYGVRITDEATGYKLVRTELLRSLDVRAKGFDFCPELTARILRHGARLVEVPISYFPRSSAEGKKITARDGIIAIWVLVRERFRPATPRGRHQAW